MCGAAGQVLEAELREWEEGQEAEKVIAARKLPLPLPTPVFTASARKG